MAHEKTILIIDDDVHIQLALKQVLMRAGYEVKIATNGAEAIEILDAGRPPMAVLVDLLMPGIVGQELLDYMRNEPGLSNVPIAIITGSPHLAPPGYKVFSKPLDAPALLEFVRSQELADSISPGPRPAA